MVRQTTSYAHLELQHPVQRFQEEELRYPSTSAGDDLLGNIIQVNLPPSFPFPTGYAVIMILSLAAGSLAHNVFALVLNAQQAKTTSWGYNIIRAWFTAVYEA